MTEIELEPWEPEETIGKLWHRFASRLDAPEAHEGAAVGLDEVGGRLAVFFRAAGGPASADLRPVREEISRHRMSWRRKLGAAQERVPRASFDGETLRLPDRLAVFASREANGALYLWLAAAAAHADAAPRGEAEAGDPDPLRADLRALRAARAIVRATIDDFPGLGALHEALCAAALALRPARSLPRAEAAVEACVRALLGDPARPEGLAADMMAAVEADSADLAPFSAPFGYRPFAPVPLWLDRRAAASGAGVDDAPETPAGGDARSEDDARTHRARRRKADQAERRDSLILHKFESILSWAEFLNLNRRVDDDDPDSAKKALDDQDEIALGQISKAPATRLKLHLDLAPEDVDRERLSGVDLRPEWEARTQSYLPDHCRILVSDAPEAEAPAPFAEDPRALRRIRAVKRRFEALRPRRVFIPAQPDGEDLDLDAAVRSRADLLASGEGSDRVWRAARNEARDLAVSILLDVSRSTESAVEGRAVIDVEREALTALALGLEACGDAFAINAFSSLRRDRVYFLRCKRFDEPMSAAVSARIAGLRPGFYTRLGAAVRQASAELSEQARKRRLLLVITDGKPNDLDHYEGRHGVEDSRMAIREARRAGHAAFGVTVDARSKAQFARIFGRGGYSVVPHPDRLTVALPDIYRHLVGA